MSPRRVATLAGAAFAVLLALPAEAARPLVRPPLTSEEEAHLGDAIATRLAAPPKASLIGTPRPGAATAPVIDDDALEALLLRFVSEDAPPAADWPWRLHVLSRPSVTSFDTAGGHVYLSRGLILACADAAELRAAILHQMAHALSRDTLATMASGYGSERIVSLARGEEPNILDGIAANLAASGTLARHAAGVEIAADAAAIRLGASPSALDALTTRLASHGRSPATWAPDVSWRRLTARHVDVHPVTRERRAALAALAAESAGAGPVSARTASLFAEIQAALASP